jgi:hypothetical protein
MQEGLEPRQLLGRIEDDRADLAAIHGACRDHLPAPALEQPVPHLRILQQLVDDGVAR